MFLGTRPFWYQISGRNFEIFKTPLARAIWKFGKCMGGQKKSKCKNHIKWGLMIFKMMWGFQIWPQNSNRITFYPLFGQKTVENGLNWVLSHFLVFWPKKETTVIRFELWGQIWNRITFDPLFGEKTVEN